MVRGIADRYWTENTGVRASDEGLTTFWDDKQESSAELDSLFDGGGDGAPAQDQAAPAQDQAGPAQEETAPAQETPAE